MKKAILPLFLFAAVLCAGSAGAGIPPALPATPGDLPELVYHLGQLPALSELEKAQTAAETINSWPGWMAAAVMARTHSGARVQIFCIFTRPAKIAYDPANGYITASTFALFPPYYPWSVIISKAAPWSEEAYWLLQGGGRSAVIYNDKEPTK